MILRGYKSKLVITRGYGETADKFIKIISLTIKEYLTMIITERDSI